MVNVDPRTIPCPVCHAPVGQECDETAGSYKGVRHFHPKRVGEALNVQDVARVLVGDQT